MGLVGWMVDVGKAQKIYHHVTHKKWKIFFEIVSVYNKSRCCQLHSWEAFNAVHIWIELCVDVFFAKSLSSMKLINHLYIWYEHDDVFLREKFYTMMMNARGIVGRDYRYESRTCDNSENGNFVLLMDWWMFWCIFQKDISMHLLEVGFLRLCRLFYRYKWLNSNEFLSYSW